MRKLAHPYSLRPFRQLSFGLLLFCAVSSSVSAKNQFPTIYFDNVPVGQTKLFQAGVCTSCSTQNCTPATYQSFVFTGPNKDEFSTDFDKLVGKTAAPGTCDSFNVTFTPKNLLTKIATLEVTSTHIGGGFIVPLVGNGPTIQIQLEKATMQPSNLQGKQPSTQTITVLVKDANGTAIPNADVSFEYNAGALVEAGGSDGHNHETVERPKGEFKKSTGSVGPDGLIRFQYTASDAAGLIQGTAQCKTPDGRSCTPKPFNIKVKVDQLQELSANALYSLIGQNSSHPRNHYGMPTLNTALVELASLYASAYSTDQTASGKLQYNDMSLPFGGVFDLKFNWLRPHGEHRNGKSADLRVQAASAVPPERRKKLAAWAMSVNLGILLHDGTDGTPPHWHLVYGPPFCRINNPRTGAACNQQNVLPPVDEEQLAATSASGVVVHAVANVFFNPSDGLYTYQYSFSNDFGSTLEVSSLQIPLHGSNATNIKMPQGWSAQTWGTNVALSFTATEIPNVPANYVDDGNLLPSPYQIKSGQSLSGFSFQSADPPAQIDFLAQGFQKLMVLSDTGEPPADSFDDSFTGVTTGPINTKPQAELRGWLQNDNNAYAYVKVQFPNSSFSVVNWGAITRQGNAFSVNAAFTQSGGPLNPAQTTTANIYNLGPLAPANYTFTFKAGGSVIAAQPFTIGVAQPNPLNDQRTFVRQQYLDFLGRDPDGPGWDFWTDNITKCNDLARRPANQTVAQCIGKQQETTSAAFFLSPEFQYTGYYVYRMYKGALGRAPYYSEFKPDQQFVSNGIVVNNQLSGPVINQNKSDFARQFVGRTEFKAIYDGLTNQQYVTKLFQTTAVTVSEADKQALVNGLNSNAETRATVLLKVVDGINVISEGNQQFTTTYGKAFYDRQLNPAFVQMQYFGYMIRDPDEAGYAFWLGKLNFYGDYITAEMVRSFIVSPEYRSRFGQP